MCGDISFPVGRLSTRRRDRIAERRRDDFFLSSFVFFFFFFYAGRLVEDKHELITRQRDDIFNLIKDTEAKKTDNESARFNAKRSEKRP